ncbi:DUF302 domain-containing protein [Saccharomonospora saliphila]|uniref:DUF302 domain-containing protein n=1 Tax=Saccharomonospora saliphila TaxID=369829 RepID=UPI00037335B6|nr:DUF302 domain-containing protein [Saccharomonospora saliphila]
MTYGISVRLAAPADEVLDRVRRALATQGFEILTEFDLRHALRTRLGEDSEPYVVLGACDPGLAHRLLTEDRRLGLVLTCTVVVRGDGEETVVDALDPQVMVNVPERPSLRPVADEAGRKLRTALDSLTASASG